MTDSIKKSKLSERIGVKNPKKINPPPVTEQPQPVPTTEETPPKKEKKSKDEIVYKCGHTRPITNYRSMACPKCNEIQRNEKIKQDRENAKKNRMKLREAEGAIVPEEVEPPFQNKRLGRLPHQSFFTIDPYDAGKMLWKGTLTVVVISPNLVFTAEASGLFKLLSTLDWQYRKWLMNKHNDLKKVEETKPVEEVPPIPISDK